MRYTLGLKGKIAAEADLDLDVIDLAQRATVNDRLNVQTARRATGRFCRQLEPWIADIEGIHKLTPRREWP